MIALNSMFRRGARFFLNFFSPDGRSTSRYLTVALIFTALVVSTIAIYLSYLYAAHNATEMLENKADEYLTFLTSVLETPLWNYDEETIKNIGLSYFQNELVENLVIASPEKIYFSIEKSKKMDMPPVNRKSEIFHGDESVGYVNISLSSSYYSAVSSQILWSSVFITLINIVSLSIIIGFLQRVLLRRSLKELSGIVNSYSSGVYNPPSGTKVSALEFKPFVKVLSDMGNTITMQMTELREAEEKYRSIFENAVEGLFQVTVDGRIMNVNPAMAQILGYSSPRALIEDMTDIRKVFVNGKEQKRFVEKVLEGRLSSGFETEFYRKDGEIIWVSLNARPIYDADGSLQHFEGHMEEVTKKKIAENELKKYRDHLEELVSERTVELEKSNTNLKKEIAERIRIENVLRESERELKSSKIKAEQANKAKSQFLANISHEIRTPLNGILGFAKLFLDEELKKEQKESINIIHESGQSLLSLINDILDLSKIEAGKFEIDEERFSLKELIENTLLITQPRAFEKGIALQYDIDDSLNELPPIVSDPKKIRQIIFNLVGNAIKFTDRGGVAVGARVEPINGDELTLTVSVKDTGCGIPADKQEFIFEPFTQVDSTDTREHSGTGLGLNITKKLVELLGGTIAVESKVEEGSVFTFTIPVRISYQDDETGVSTETKIMIVEDDAATMKLYKNYFEKSGYSVLSVMSGSEAVSTARIHQPDIIVLDIMLPDLSGWKVLTELKENELTSNIPVIVASALLEKNKAFSLGAIDYLKKPIDMRTLIDRINSVIFHPHTDSGLNILVVDDDEQVVNYINSALAEDKFTVHPFTNPLKAIDFIKNGAQIDLAIVDIFMSSMDGFDFMRQLKNDARLREIPIIFLTTKDLTPDYRLKLDGINHLLLNKSELTNDGFFKEIDGFLTKLSGKKKGKAEPPPLRAEKKIGSPGRILLVEDNRVNQELVKRVLTKEGFDVIIAVHGSEAIEVVKVDDSISLILMDIQMPVMDGYEATKRIKAEERFKHIPIIATTAHAMKEDERKIMAVGFDGYLSKPIVFEELIDEVSKHFVETGDDDASINEEISAAYEEELKSMYNEYFQILPKEVDNLMNALYKSDYKSISQIGHDLKGTGSLFDQEKITELGKAIESAANKKNRDHLKTLIDSLNDHIESLK